MNSASRMNAVGAKATTPGLRADFLRVRGRAHVRGPGSNRASGCPPGSSSLMARASGGIYPAPTRSSASWLSWQPASTCR
jgi:hypothetical protein